MQLRRTLQLAATFLSISASAQLPALGLLMAFGAGGSSGAGTANISLIDASATVTQTGDMAWTLDKSGSLSGNTVSWNIVATPVATTAGLLVFNGQMTVFNYGTGPATSW